MRSVVSLATFICFALPVFAQAGIELASNDLQLAIEEYLAKTVEGQAIFDVMVSERHDADVYVLGGAAARVVRAVHAYLEDNSPEREGLPERLIDLLSYSQDLDLVIDLPKEALKALEKKIAEALPYKLGDESRFQLITLYPSPKRGFLENPDILKQNTDSFSTGLVRIVRATGSMHTPIIDIRNPGSPSGGEFVASVLANKITYYDEDEHKQTEMAQRGRNPKAVSAIKFLVNIVRYGADYEGADLRRVARIIKRFQGVLNRIADKRATDAEKRLDDDYVLDRMELNLIKGLIETADIQRALSLYAKVQIPQLIAIMDEEFPASDRGYSHRWQDFGLLATWLGFLQSRNLSSLDVQSTQDSSVPINKVDFLPNGTLIDGSFEYGGEHPPMFVDLGSFEFFLFRVFALYLQKIKFEMEPHEVVALAEKYLYYVNEMIDRKNLGDPVVKFLMLPQYKCGPDCRNDSVTAKILYSFLKFDARIIAYEDHTGNFVNLDGRFHQVSSYDEDPEHKAGLFSLDDYTDEASLVGDYELKVALPASEAKAPSVADHLEAVLATLPVKNVTLALNYILGFFENVAEDPEGQVLVKRELQKVLDKSPIYKELGGKKIKSDYFTMDVPLTRCEAVSNID